MANWIKFGDHGAVNLDLISSYRVYPGEGHDIMAVFVCGKDQVHWNYSDPSFKSIFDFSEFTDVYENIDEFMINCINNPSDKIRFLEDYIKENSDLRISKFLNDFSHDFSHDFLIEINKKIESDESLSGIRTFLSGSGILDISFLNQRIKTGIARRFFWQILIPSINWNFLGKIQASPAVSFEKEEEYDSFRFFLELNTDLIKKDIPKIKK